MITYILILWILITLNAPMWTYVLLGLGFLIKTIDFGVKIGKLGKEN